MISMRETLAWLNRFDRSHLNGTNQQLLSTARNRRTTHTAAQDAIRAALAQARNAPLDRLDYPETLLNCAAVEFDRGLVEQARDHLEEARALYRQAADPYGAAVASWMLGMAELELHNTDAAYRSWKRSAQALKRMRAYNTHVRVAPPNPPGTREWYEDLYIRMNGDLVALPQESFSWLNQFTASRLSVFNRGLIDQINDHIRDGNRDPAYRLIGTLKERASASPDPLEHAEILVETGLASYRLRDLLPAIEDLKLAVIRHPAGSHQQEVTRWLLGSIQVQTANHWLSGVNTWEKSLAGFTMLASTADHANRRQEKRWYRDRIVYMKRALKVKLTEGPDAGLSDSRSDGTTAPPSANGQDRFQYLCGLVGGDQARAERLIEYERRFAPNAGRGELIERAIQRLLDDRR